MHGISFGVELLSEMLELVDILLVRSAEYDHIVAAHHRQGLLEDFEFVEQARVLQASKGGVGRSPHDFHDGLDELLDLLAADFALADSHLFRVLGQDIILDLKNRLHQTVADEVLLVLSSQMGEDEAGGVGPEEDLHSLKPERLSLFAVGLE